jgi:hypothetical protein
MSRGPTPKPKRAWGNEIVGVHHVEGRETHRSGDNLFDRQAIDDSWRAGAEKCVVQEIVRLTGRT